MQKPWFASYPPGVPAQIDIARFASLVELFDHSVERFRERPAFSNMGVVIRYGEFDRLARAMAAYFSDELALVKGERVAIMLPNLLQYPVVLAGALRSGLVVVNVNPLFTADELATELADAAPAAIVVLENFAARLQDALRQTTVTHVIVTRVGDLFPAPKRWMVNFAVKHLKHMVPAWHIPGAVRLTDALARGARRTPPQVAISAQDIAFLQYTGGTTGVPKGAILTHGNMVANVLQTAAWIGTALKAGEETVITALPLYHIFALTANLLVFALIGGHNVLITNPRDLKAFVAELAKARFTAITGVNTLFAALLDAEGFDAVRRANAGALKIAVAGGMAVQRTTAQRWHQAMGVPLIEGYGLTEASPIVCANRFDIREFTGKLGLPVPSTEVVILDEAGHELPLGESGEIAVRGPQVMRGYWRRLTETAQVLSADGWLRTGDVGVMDEHGYVEFVDRRKDMIVVSGFKAYPAEIEAVAMSHPGVRDAGAVGVPDKHSGEAVMLFIVKRDPALSAEAIQAHCAAHLTGYKRPKYVVFRDQLPKSPIGKVLRRELKRDVAQTHG